MTLVAGRTFDICTCPAIFVVDFNPALMKDKNVLPRIYSNMFVFHQRRIINRVTINRPGMKIKSPN